MSTQDSVSVIPVKQQLTSLCLYVCWAAYEDLQRAFDKANKLADKGDPKDWPPHFFIRCLVEVDDFVNEVVTCNLMCFYVCK